MNRIKYITQDREAGNVIDEFETRAEAEAAIRAYEEDDRANGCYEEDFYDIKEREEIEAYEVWRVPNGRFDDWRKGITSNCKWIGDGFENLKDAQELRDECAEDDERYACTHQIAKTIRDDDFNLLSFELA